MSNFHSGDKVVIVKNFHIWSGGGFPKTSVLTVIDDRDDTDTYINRSELTIELMGVNGSPNDFKLVDAPFGGFVSENTTGLIGEAASETVMPITLNTTNVYSQGLPPSGMITLEQTVRAEPTRFGSFHGGSVVAKEVERTLLQGYKDALTKSHESREPGILGVFRPNLEDRKVGKVRVELVDDGFPLALREIAKVMTWAQTAKGYKDHDWQNLPNPEQGLAGATSRHRTDHVIQRMVGKSAAIECTDHESEILHKAHEAFGVLAQLELILRGVIK